MTTIMDKDSKVQHNKLKRPLDTSSHDDDTYKKRQATAFKYDTDLHSYQREDDRKMKYKCDNASNIYKVNVKKSHGGIINRIGLGKILYRMKVENIKACKMVSKNIACVHFSRKENANLLVDTTQLRDFGYDAAIPGYYRTVIGVIKNVPTDITAKEIFDEISAESEIIKIERMTRRMPNGHRDYALNVKIHFDGDKLPPHVTIYHGREKVHPYIAPVLQCTGCLRYGHQLKACKASKEAAFCSRCGSKDHQRDECGELRPTCIHCKKDHEATARQCPERVRQNNIRILMTGEKLSFHEVIEKYPQYTSQNEFNLLENMTDFPPLQRNTYRNQLTGKKQKLVFTNERKRKISSTKQPDKYSSHYNEHAININASPSTTRNSQVIKMTTEEQEAIKMASDGQKVIKMTPVQLGKNLEGNFSNDDSISGYSDNESINSETPMNESLRFEEQQNNTINMLVTQS